MARTVAEIEMTQGIGIEKSSVIVIEVEKEVVAGITEYRISTGSLVQWLLSLSVSTIPTLCSSLNVDAAISHVPPRLSHGTEFKMRLYC